MLYDARPDRIGWTVFEVDSGRPVSWDGVTLAGLDLEPALEVVRLLHRGHRAGSIATPEIDAREDAHEWSKEALDGAIASGASVGISPPAAVRR